MRYNTINWGATITNYQYTNSTNTHLGKPGFSLAEIIIVLGIVGIIISGILPVFLNTITAGKAAAHYSTAYKLADSKIEDYRNTNFDTLASEEIEVGELPDGTISTIITDEIDGSHEGDMRKIDLTISWHFKRDQQVRIVTYVYRGGL